MFTDTVPWPKLSGARSRRDRRVTSESPGPGRVAPFTVMYSQPTHARPCDPANHRRAALAQRSAPQCGGKGSGLRRTPIAHRGREWNTVGATLPNEHRGCQLNNVDANRTLRMPIEHRGCQLKVVGANRTLGMPIVYCAFQ